MDLGSVGRTFSNLVRGVDEWVRFTKGLSSIYAYSGPQVWGFEERDVESPAPSVDIVFVHGLCGDPLETWGASTSDTYFPLTLAREIGAECDVVVRALTVEYNTALLCGGADGDASIEELGRDVRHALKAAGVGARPVIFVCHSLGGLVVKSVLTGARRRTTWPELLDETLGVLFLGTPHKGARPGAVAKLVLELTGLSLMQPKYQQQLAREFGRGPLKELHEDFVWLLEDRPEIAALAFAETVALPSGVQVVDEESGTAGWPETSESGPTAKSWAVNHFAISRLQPQTPPFIDATRELARWTRTRIASVAPPLDAEPRGIGVREHSADLRTLPTKAIDAPGQQGPTWWMIVFCIAFGMGLGWAGTALGTALLDLRPKKIAFFVGSVSWTEDLTVVLLDATHEEMPFALEERRQVVAVQPHQIEQEQTYYLGAFETGAPDEASDVPDVFNRTVEAEWLNQPARRFPESLVILTYPTNVERTGAWTAIAQRVETAELPVRQGTRFVTALYGRDDAWVATPESDSAAPHNESEIPRSLRQEGRALAVLVDYDHDVFLHIDHESQYVESFSTWSDLVTSMPAPLTARRCDDWGPAAVDEWDGTVRSCGDAAVAFDVIDGTLTPRIDRVRSPLSEGIAMRIESMPLVLDVPGLGEVSAQAPGTSLEIHWHWGELMVRVVEGVASVESEGLPRIQLRAGDEVRLNETQTCVERGGDP